MLNFVKDLGCRGAEYSISPLPEQEKTQLLNTLHQIIGEVSQSALVPPENEAFMKNVLAEASPTLSKIGARLSEKLNSKYSMILISRTWIDHLDLDSRAAILFALSMSMGSPTPTDQVERKVVWDIRALGNKMRAGHVPTFSEHSFEARLHTDTQYYQAPERFMMLYSNQPAKCGGGVSFSRDISCIKQALCKTDKGRWALEILEREALPFRVPMSFTQDAKEKTEEVTCASILSDRPHIRYRQDTLEQGFEIAPEMETPNIREALNIFSTELNRSEMKISTLLQRDGLMLFNNHECLHGRTAFTDLERHAFRIRIAEQQDKVAV